MIERRGQRCLMTKIPRQRHQRNSWIFVRCLFEQCLGPVGAAIVHKNDFMRSSRNLIQNLAGAPQEFGQHCLFVINRNGQRNSDRGLHRKTLSSEYRKLPGSKMTFSSATLDRKSTRLNSSHSSISYAVFCLK